MTDNLYLTNQFLIAMPNLTDPYFMRSVTYICEHNQNGAIGIVINQPLEINLAEVFQQMEITGFDDETGKMPVLCGGPIHPERGFVIHRTSGEWRSSMVMQSEISVTTSRDILQAIAEKRGPQQMLVSLGYANWTAGQLEQEILNNFWLTSAVNEDILFKLPFDKRWDAAMKYLGVDPNHLIINAGHA